MSSAQGALRGPGFYECVKCLVDTLNLIYDHNNNRATGLRERQQPRENKIWKHKAQEGNVFSQGFEWWLEHKWWRIKGIGFGEQLGIASSAGEFLSILVSVWGMGRSVKLE